MASGDLTATELFKGSASSSSLLTDIDTGNLAAATDHLLVIPIEGRDQQVRIIKVEREA